MKSDEYLSLNHWYLMHSIKLISVMKENNAIACVSRLECIKFCVKGDGVYIICAWCLWCWHCSAKLSRVNKFVVPAHNRTLTNELNTTFKVSFSLLFLGRIPYCLITAYPFWSSGSIPKNGELISAMARDVLIISDVQGNERKVLSLHRLFQERRFLCILRYQRLSGSLFVAGPI